MRRRSAEATRQIALEHFLHLNLALPAARKFLRLCTGYVVPTPGIAQTFADVLPTACEAIGIGPKCILRLRVPPHAPIALEHANIILLHYSDNPDRRVRTHKFQDVV